MYSVPGEIPESSLRERNFLRAEEIGEYFLWLFFIDIVPKRCFKDAAALFFNKYVYVHAFKLIKIHFSKSLTRHFGINSFNNREDWKWYDSYSNTANYPVIRIILMNCFETLLYYYRWWRTSEKRWNILCCPVPVSILIDRHVISCWYTNSTGKGEFFLKPKSFRRSGDQTWLQLWRNWGKVESAFKKTVSHRLSHC